MADEKKPKEPEQEKKPEPEQSPAPKPEGLLAVEFIRDEHGYHRGSQTHFSARQARALEKAGAVKVLGELDKTHKLLPIGGKK